MKVTSRISNIKSEFYHLKKVKCRADGQISISLWIYVGTYAWTLISRYNPTHPTILQMQLANGFQLDVLPQIAEVLIHKISELAPRAVISAII